MELRSLFLFLFNYSPLGRSQQTQQADAQLPSRAIGGGKKWQASSRQNFGTSDAVTRITDAQQPLRRRHSDAQSRADRVNLSDNSTGPTLEGRCDERAEMLVPSLIHQDEGITKSSDRSGGSSVEDNTRKRPSAPRNHTDGSLVAARWVACQAGFVTTHEETASSSKSHTTQSTQSPANSTASIATTPGSHLPALQSISLTDQGGLKPLPSDENDPTSFDLLAPPDAPRSQFSVEVKSELLLSVEHLRVIFDNPRHMQKFTEFLYALKPGSVPLLKYYLNLVKALRAIGYADAIIRELATTHQTPPSELPLAATIAKSLTSRASETFGVLAQEELPAYVAHVWTRIVNLTIKQRITNTLPPNLRDLSEGLTDVFCLTDPSRDDNPVVFASEEFHRTTQYGRRFALGRNCRFLQGPKTNQHSVHRLREMLVVGKEHCEPLLNYRRDGSVFMNLLMVTPLYDNRGTIRYHLGAQVDVSGLLKECAGLASLGELVARKQNQCQTSTNQGYRATGNEPRSSRDALGDLAELFTLGELKTVQASGEMVHEAHFRKPSRGVRAISKTRSNLQAMIQEEMASVTAPPAIDEPMALETSISSSSALTPPSCSSLTNRAHGTSSSSSGNSSRSSNGIFDHYLLVRPCPSMRILFASPSLRVPGILQSPLMSRIGGSQSIRDAILRAFKDGDGITTKARWLARPVTSGSNANANANTSTSTSIGAGSGPGLAHGNGHGRSRWIHTTPLLGVDGAIGVWMVILVDDEEKRRGPKAPPIEAFDRLERPRPFDVVLGLDGDRDTREHQGDQSGSEGAAEDEDEEGRLLAEVNTVSIEQDEVVLLELGTAKVVKQKKRS